MQTAPVTALTFASPWSITPSATVRIVASVSRPARMSTTALKKVPPKTSSAKAEAVASATRPMLTLESALARPDVQSAVTSVRLWSSTSVLSAHGLFGATDVKTKTTRISPSTIP